MVICVQFCKIIMPLLFEHSSVTNHLIVIQFIQIMPSNKQVMKQKHRTRDHLPSHIVTCLIPGGAQQQMHFVQQIYLFIYLFTVSSTRPFLPLLAYTVLLKKYDESQNLCQIFSKYKLCQQYQSDVVIGFYIILIKLCSVCNYQMQQFILEH